MSDEPDKLRVVSIFDEPTVAVGGETLNWVPVRRILDVGAFGINAFRAARAGEAIIEEHVESPGQEEVYLVVRGGVRFTVDDQVVEGGPGQLVFVPDPRARRSGVAIEDESVVLAVGGWRDEPYHALPWEPIYLAQAPAARGQWKEAIEVLEAEAGDHRETPIVRFRMACYLAQDGNTAKALEELQAALEARPGMAEMAAKEPLLDPLRELDGWPSSAE